MPTPAEFKALDKASATLVKAAEAYVQAMKTVGYESKTYTCTFLSLQVKIVEKI